MAADGAEAAVPRKVVIVPLVDGGEVEVASDELPEEPSEVTALLRDENTKPALWLEVALLYFYQKRAAAYEDILTEAIKVFDDEASQQMMLDYNDDKIMLVSSLFSYTVLRAGDEVLDSPERNAYLDRARQLMQRIEKIDHRSPWYWVAMGTLHLVAGKHEEATKSLVVAIERHPKNLGIRLVLACALLGTSQAKQALHHLRTLLENLPGVDVAVTNHLRLGIAFCHHVLGNKLRASQAYELVLEHDAGCTDAMVGMALLQLQGAVGPSVGESAAADIAAAFERFAVAFKQAPTNGLVLGYLAQYHLWQGDSGAALQLASSSFRYSGVSEVRAEACFLLGKVFHQRAEWDKALNFYHQAALLWPQMLVAHFGLGQVYTHHDRLDRARHHFELVLAEHPTNWETLRALAKLYVHTKDRDRAIATVKALNKHHPTDVEGHFLAGLVLMRVDRVAALAAFEKGARLLEKAGESVPAYIWNNIGALRHKQGDLDGADEAFTKSEELLEPEYANTMGITISYNHGRVLESRNNLSQARRAYEGILQRQQNYTDCYLRLAHMERSVGRIDKALSKCHEALGWSPDHPDARTMEAMFLAERGDYSNAIKALDDLLQKKMYSKDMYARLYKAHIQRLKDRRHDAIETYRSVLKFDPTNMAAANGIGVYLAEQGWLHQAKDIFLLVREATDDHPEAYTNLAHSYLAIGNIPTAISLYHACLKKFYYNRNVPIFNNLARAYIEAKKLEDARKVLLRGLHVEPHNVQLWFNLAYIQQTIGVSILDRKNLSTREIQYGITSMRSALRFFRQLSTKLTDRQKRSKIVDVSAIASSINILQKFLDITAPEKLKSAAEREQRLERDQQAALEVRRKREREQEEREEKIKQEQAAERERALELVRETQEKTGLDIAMEEAPPKRQRKSTSKKPRKSASKKRKQGKIEGLDDDEDDEGDDDEDEDEDDEDGGDDEFGNSQRSKRVRTVKDEMDLDDDDDDDDGFAFGLITDTKPKEPKKEAMDLDDNNNDDGGDDAPVGGTQSIDGLDWLDSDDEDDEPKKKSRKKGA